MKNQQSGFTLIELVAVIVILSILAVTALPKFADLSDAAKQASTDAIAGNIASAMAMNYGAALAVEAGVLGVTKVTVAQCDTASTALLVGGVPTGYAVTPAAPLSDLTLGAVADTCTVTHTASGTTATFTAIAVP